ncbi:MAG: hypothetical protein WC680_10060 [Sulfuricurvum sp.]|jgi:EAL and modified HD-GYP domain-containing signal transduction protein
MQNKLNLARQPIINHQNDILGYEFFYRDAQGKCSIDDPRHATSSVLVNLLNQIGTALSFGNKLAFINTDGPLLLTEVIRTLPKAKIIFELSSSMRHTKQIHDAIRYYHSQGYRFALDNASLNPQYIESFAPIFPYMEFAKFDVTQTDSEEFQYCPNPYGKMRLIAYKIEFNEIFEAYKQFNFHYFQGYYFEKPHLITQKRIDPKNIHVLSLFSLLQTDAPVHKICEIFERENALYVQLMQFLSSTNTVHTYDTSSIQETIKQMGRIALTQWLLLIIYSKSGTMAND